MGIGVARPGLPRRTRHVSCERIIQPIQTEMSIHTARGVVAFDTCPNL